MASFPPSRFYSMPPAATSQAGLIPYPEDSSLLNQHGTYDLNRTTFAPRQPSSAELSPRLTGPYTPEPSWALLEPDLSLKQALNSDHTHSSTGARSRNRNAAHLTKPMLIISSLFPTLAATSQLLLLVYLLDVYVSLPPSATGGRPRISPVYSIWPYVSCVGSTRLTAYRIFGFLFAFFYLNTFTLDMYMHRHVQGGQWLRWARLGLSAVCGGALIAVVFASADYESHVHLYVVSVQAVAFTAVKTLTWAIDHAVRRRHPLLRADRNARLAARWRCAVYVVGAPVGVATVVGIYACRDPVAIQTKGTACYVLAAVAAVGDWVYQLISVAFLLSLAFDLYQAGHYAEVRWRGENGGEDRKMQRVSTLSAESGESSARYQRV